MELKRDKKIETVVDAVDGEVVTDHLPSSPKLSSAVGAVLGVASELAIGLALPGLAAYLAQQVAAMRPIRLQPAVTESPGFPGFVISADRSAGFR